MPPVKYSGNDFRSPARLLFDQESKLTEFANFLIQHHGKQPNSSRMPEWYGFEGIGKSILLTRIGKQPYVLSGAGLVSGSREGLGSFTGISHQGNHRKSVSSNFYESHAAHEFGKTSVVSDPDQRDKLQNSPAAKRKTRRKPKFRIGPFERTLCFIATLILAGFIANSGLETPAIWGFLGVAIGLLFGKIT